MITSFKSLSTEKKKYVSSKFVNTINNNQIPISLLYFWSEYYDKNLSNKEKAVYQK